MGSKLAQLSDFLPNLDLTADPNPIDLAIINAPNQAKSGPLYSRTEGLFLTLLA